MLNKVSIKTVADINDLFFYLPGLDTYDLLQPPAARRVSHVHTSEQQYCSVDCRPWPVEKLLGKHTSQWHVTDVTEFMGWLLLFRYFLTSWLQFKEQNNFFFFFFFFLSAVLDILR